MNADGQSIVGSLARNRCIVRARKFSRVRDNINACESRMSQLDSIVADGGQLQQMIEQVAERKAGSQAVA